MLPTIGLFLFIVIQNPFFEKPDTPLTGQINPIPKPIPTLNETRNEQETSTSLPTIKKESVVVDIKGQVVSPGVYTLSNESRVLDAIKRAGGLLPSADSKVLNLAAKLSDEMVLYIPEIGEIPPVVEGSFPTKNTSKESSLVNINTAEETELMSLPGIGPSKAKAIISYREDKGPFNSIEDMKNVTGIGDRTFESLQEFITVN
ncbi:MAG: helix-hairpin-helix domain-containing protein [Paenisporosarcina sp.]